MSANRRIRVFVSSTFRDMVEERNELMTHTWPELRRFCRERQVELVEVDLRWGIAEEQSTRRETLKICLDEIRASRPFFVGLLGERYGWTPDENAFTPDLLEEQPWLKSIESASVTELEIFHGVLNHPDMAECAFFYFRDPGYALNRGEDFLPASPADAARQSALKDAIRVTCAGRNIPLHENYPDPQQLAAMVLNDLLAAVDARFPIESVPDPVTREAREHEAFAEARRRTYIGRPGYFEALDRHAASDGGPLLLLGDSGSGKSALLANWLEQWRTAHPEDFVFQHYIGSTPGSSGHWLAMFRLIAEIRRWTGDPEELPQAHDEILKSFSAWLAKARSKAQQDGVRCILILDALNQLEDRDHSRQLGWLPEHVFHGPLRLVASTLPGDTLHALDARGWAQLHVEPLTPDERSRMIAGYLARFGMKLDAFRLERLASASAASNPLYLKILLDELRVTGTHAQLDERLGDYLAAPHIPALLARVLSRYQLDYERDRRGLVGEVLGLIWAARRGLSETEIQRLLKPSDLPRLPLATWSPLRAALEENLVDHGGILNFAHEFMRAAVERAFVPDEDRARALRLQLADFFEQQPVTARSCEELSWLLLQTGSTARLRTCLLDMDRFAEMYPRDPVELGRYWVELGEQRAMGEPYLASFERWSAEPGREKEVISRTANQLSHFLNATALYGQAEPLMRLALDIEEERHGPDHPFIAAHLNNIAEVLKATNRLAEAEPLYRRALAIDEKWNGPEHPLVAESLSNLAQLLKETNRPDEAERLMRRALAIQEQNYGPDHPKVAMCLGNLASSLLASSKPAEAEPLMRRVLAIDERSYGPDHPEVARDLGNLAQLLQTTNRMAEAEPLMRRALTIGEQSYGPDHPKVALRLSNLAALLFKTNRPDEAEPLMRRALAINEECFGPDHPEVATLLTNLAQMLKDRNQLAEAEPLMRRALDIDERSYGPNHPRVATCLANLAGLLRTTSRLTEAEPLLRRALEIDERSYPADHPSIAEHINGLAMLFRDTNRLADAEPLMRRALAICEQSYGPNNPEVARKLNDLALLLRDTGRLAEAEPLMRRVVSIFESSLGEDHSYVATSLNNLALLLKATNRLAEAEPLYRRSLAIRERCYGPVHPDVANTLSNLGLLLQAMDHLEEAEPLQRRALAVAEQCIGPDHPDVAFNLNGLVLLLRRTDRQSEAEPLMRRVLEIFLKFTQSTGYLHPRFQDAVNSYFGLLREMGLDEKQAFAVVREICSPYGIELG